MWVWPLRLGGGGEFSTCITLELEVATFVVAVKEMESRNRAKHRNYVVKKGSHGNLVLFTALLASYTLHASQLSLLIETAAQSTEIFS